MHFRITFCGLLASNFVRNLRQVLVSEMGLKSFGPSRDNTLGIKVTREPLILLRLIFPSKKSLTSCKKSCLMMDQHLLTNRPVKLSGPGTLSVGKCLSTSSISSYEKGADKSSKPGILDIKEPRSKPISIPWPTLILFLKEPHRTPAIC